MEDFITFLIQGPHTTGSDYMPEITDIDVLGNNLWNYFKNIAVILGVIFLIVSGYLYFTSFGNDEKAEKAKKSMVYTIIGLVLVASASIIVQTITGSVAGDTLTAAPVINLADQVAGMLFAGAMALATLFIIVAGYQFITAGGDEEKIKKALSSVRYSVIGVAVMSFAYVIVGIFFENSGGDVTPKINAGKAVTIIVGITKFLLAIVGFLAILMLIYSGLSYITARGEEEQMTKAKKGITGSLIGLIIIVFSWTLANIAFKISPTP